MNGDELKELKVCIDDLKDTMHKNKEEMLIEVTAVKNEVALMNQNVEKILSPMVKKHEELLCGDNKQMGKGGLINEVTNLRTIGIWVWGGITSGTTVLITWTLNKVGLFR